MGFWKKDSNVPDENTDDDLTQVLAQMQEATGTPSDSVLSSHQHNKSAKQMRDEANAHAESLELRQFPKEMSCMTALDELLECMSLGGQVRNYYRYGDLTMCEKQSAKVSFCMRNSSKSPHEKEKSIQEFYKKQLIDKLQHGSSEDVWEIRK